MGIQVSMIGTVNFLDAIKKFKTQLSGGKIKEVCFEIQKE
jgi:hypothetical protein